MALTEKPMLDDIAFLMKTVSENNKNNQDPKFCCFHGHRIGSFGLLELLNDRGNL